MSRERTDDGAPVSTSEHTADDRAHDAGADPWDCLAVISRLEVGPVTVEPRRLIAPYRVTQGDRTDQIDLIYRFEEDVFDPANREDHNLACMILAQVALNYGLFADEIRFHGVFDSTDRQFLRRMAENTAREITVKKFLEPNPFLIGQAANLPPVVRSRYSRARLRFVGASTFEGQSPLGYAPAPWGQTLERHAVLSSGGKRESSRARSSEGNRA